MHKDFFSRLYARLPWDDSLTRFFKDRGFEEPRQAWENFVIIAGQANFPDLFPDLLPEFLVLLTESYQPDSALSNFEHFSRKILDKNYLYTLLSRDRLLLRALVTLFSGSQALTDTLLSQPAYFDWLKRPETLRKPKSKDVLYRDFHAMAGAAALPENTPSLLRRFKKREYIRIGLRDLMELTDLRENVEDISNLADVCLQIAYEFADASLKRKYGTPVYESAAGEWVESEFAVIGMGKLGGRELNYSSDIDLIYVYASGMGETRRQGDGPVPALSISNHEYFTKLGQAIARIIGEITPDGSVFRVDLDLRPEGPSGEIANSLAGSEIYYQSWGKTWERQALIKGRVCAGSEALGREFFSMLEPFVYRRSLDFEAVAEIKEMKRRIDADLRRKNAEKGHIKLGVGGIREIEFTVQAYQLLFGGRHKSLRVANTPRALAELLGHGFISADEERKLREAYIFLRRLENRVQMSFGLQTHSLPRNDRDIAILARKMGIRGDSPEATVAGFRAVMETHTRHVGEIFANLLAEEEQRQATEIASAKIADQRLGARDFTRDLLKPVPFADAERAFRFLKALRDGPEFSHPTEKSVRDFYLLLPRLLALCARVPMPGLAVENLVRFIEASRARETFLDLFLGNEKLLELLVILFGSSDLLSRILIDSPELMDVLTAAESIYRFKTPEKTSAELMENLRARGDLDARKTFLRRFKRAEELRIGIRYLIRETDLPGTLGDLSALADIYLDAVLRIALDAARRQFGPRARGVDDFVVFGLGKLGGRELNFGSDLDVVFVHDEPRASETPLPPEEIVTFHAAVARTIYQLASEPTPAGVAYKIDAELRPEGNQGTLTISAEGYRDYFRGRARVWERQAMTRARFVAGKPALGDKFLKIVHDFVYRPKLEYGSLIEIARSRERMEKELARENQKGKNVKLGFGGLADIEFSVQILQMMHGCRHPRLRQTNTLDSLKTLAAAGMIEHDAAERLTENYLFLRNMECAMRIKDTQATNHLPRNPAALADLARLLGYGGGDVGAQMLRDYDRVTAQVREFYRKNLDTLLRISL